MMKFLHAFAALLTVVLFLLQRHCVMARVCRAKRICSSFEPFNPKKGSRKSMQQPRPAECCGYCARAAAAAAVITTSCSVMPKYKRDPDIQIDNEHIGVPPRV